jgi:hypothetical protein
MKRQKAALNAEQWWLLGKDALNRMRTGATPRARVANGGDFMHAQAGIFGFQLHNEVAQVWRQRAGGRQVASTNKLVMPSASKR